MRRRRLRRLRRLLLGEHASRLAAFVGVVALGVIDVALITDGQVSNGFWSISSEKAYHLALWTTYGALGYLIVRG